MERVGGKIRGERFWGPRFRRPDLSAGSSQRGRWERERRSRLCRKTSETAAWPSWIDARPPARDLFTTHTNNKTSSTLSPFFLLFSIFYFLFSRRQNATTITLFFFSPFSWAPKCWTEKLFFAPLPAPEMGETTDRFQSIGVVVVDVAPFYWHEIMRVQWKMVAITLSLVCFSIVDIPSIPPPGISDAWTKRRHKQSG